LGLNGLLANAVQTTMYALAAHVYPTEVRASGIASAAAVGRIGAMMSSFTGAALIQTGTGAYIGVLAISMAITAAGLAIVRNHIHGFGLRR
jgi:AAHS family 4-hydroxybenzoate transporter-like MFS transporter